LIINAFVDVVADKPKYNIVLKDVIPKNANKVSINQFFLKELNICLYRKTKIGNTIKNTKAHLKKANSSGVISSLINLPITKLTDQNRIHNIKKK